MELFITRRIRLDSPPGAPWFDINGKVIPNHPQRPQHLSKLADHPADAALRLAKRNKRHQRAERREKALRDPLPPLLELVPERHIDDYPDYPED